MRSSLNASLPSLPSTATWSLTLLANCACSLLINTWRRLVKENSNAAPVGRRPPSSSPANPSGLHIVFRRGSVITSNNGSPVPWDNWNPKKESIPSIAAGSSGLDRLKLHPVIQTLRSRRASRWRVGTEGGTRTRCFLRRRPERFEIGRGACAMA